MTPNCLSASLHAICPPGQDAMGVGPKSSGAHQTHGSPPQPRHGSLRLCQPCLFQQGIVGAFAQADDDLFPCDLDESLRVDELPEQTGGARPDKALQPFAQSAVQEVRQYRQGQVEIYIQANIAAQAIEVKKRDLFTKVVLDVIPARVSLDDLPRRLWLGQVIGQEESRGFVPQPRHDQLPCGALVAVEPDPFIDILDLAALPLRLGDLAVLPTVRGQPLHACQHPRTATADGDESNL